MNCRLIIFLLLFPAIIFAQTASHPIRVVVKLRAGVNSTSQISSFGTVAPFLPLTSRKNPRISTANPAFSTLEQYQILTLPVGSSANDALASLRSLSSVESAEISREHQVTFAVPQKISSSFSESDGMKQQWGLQAVSAESAWQKATGKGVIVGVVDTGIDFYHEDLKHKLWINSAEDINHNGTFEPWPDTVKINGVSGDLDGIDQDGNGFPDDVIGYDFVNQSILGTGDWSFRDAIPYDENGHGTNVSGVIAAERGNGLGVVGVAYDAKIMTLRAFDATGNSEDADVASAIVYGAMNGANVMNMSFGDVYFSPIVQDALHFAYSMGVVLVASSGNDGGTDRHFPSNYNEVIAVGATMPDDKLWFRTVNGSLLDLTAPGVNIFTTVRGDSYGAATGTSLSSPFVSAVAALVKQIHHDYSPEEIRGVLQATCDDLGAKGWDIEFGAGRLNAFFAVNSPSATLCELISPVNEQEFRTKSKISVLGSAISPIFSSYQLFYGKGKEPNEWVTITQPVLSQKIRDTLGSFDAFATAGDTLEFTLRLILTETNGKTLERRSRFSVFVNPISLTHFNKISAWHDDCRVVVIDARADRRCRFSVRFRPKNSVFPFQEINDVTEQTQNHTVVIGDEAQADVLYEAIAQVMTSGGDTVLQSFEFTRPSEAFPVTGFTQKPYSAPSSAYFLPNVSDFYGDGKPSFCLYDPTNKSIKTIQYSAGKMKVRDSLQSTWIPQGIGDSNGDGIPEILAQYGGLTALFQANSRSGNPFSNQIWQPTDGSTGVAMADLDGDGVPEILTRGDTSFFVWKFTGGKYQKIANAPNLTAGSNTFGPLLCAVGDFDGDGNTEFCYGDANGDFSIFEFKNGTCKQEFTLENSLSDVNPYVLSADVDGDGKPELLIGWHSQLTPNADREYSSELWTFKLLKSKNVNKYEVVWSENFYGVRDPVLFKSGVACGDVDGKPGQELILSIFPNLYVLSWNSALQKFDLVWNYPLSFSNAAIVYDFDGNGTKELCFNDASAITAWEFSGSNKPTAPSGFSAYAQDETSAFLSWNSVSGATSYNIYRGLLPENATSFSVSLVGTTTATTFINTGLKNNTRYGFVVSAIGANGEGETTLPAVVFTHTPILADSVWQKSPQTLEVHFTGLLPQTTLQSSLFALKKWGIPSSVSWLGIQTLLLEFPYELPVGAQQLAVGVFNDGYNSPTRAGTLNFTIASPGDDRELFLSRLSLQSKSLIELWFSESVDSIAGALASNYILEPFGTIQSVEFFGDRVNLHLDGHSPIGALGKLYLISTRNITAKSGRKMTKGAGSSLGFTLVADGVSGAFAYPNPVHISDGETVMFANLPASAQVLVRTLNGEVLARLTESDGNGGVEWDCRNTIGDIIPSGVYLFSVKTTDANGVETESEFKKFAVVR